MKIEFARCAGLDVHLKTVVACVVTPEGRETRTFSTRTRGLRELVAWLEAKQVTHVAMESTGVYWKPVFNLLEETECELLLVNAHHIKQVPGRKTDVKDAEWIANLLQHGLLTSSYVPDRDQRELRELVRYRRKLIQTRASEVQRVQKVLEGANIKLSSVISDITGVSGMAILGAIIEGETDPATLAALGHKRLRASKEEIAEAVDGIQGAHQRMLMKAQFRHIEFLNQELQRLDDEVAKRTVPFDEQVAALDAIPGVARRSAEEILAEIGLDMEQFPSDAHLTSWAKVSPGNHESAGKKTSGKTGKGNRWLRSALVESAMSAIKVKDTFYGDIYRRLALRRGAKRAIFAVARRILQTIYFMLKRREPYRELNTAELQQSLREQRARRAVRQLNKLGYHVSLDPLAS